MIISTEKSNIETREKEFWQDIYSNPVAAEETADALFAFFQRLSYKGDEEYRTSYFRWYTILTWQRLRTYPKEFIVAEAVKRQIPMALLCGVNVLDELIWYSAARVWLPDEMKIFYSDIRVAFEGSEAVIGVFQGKNVLMKDLIAEVKRIFRPDADSIRLAEMNVRIKNTFFGQNKTEFVRLDDISPDVVIKRFVELVIFFTKTEPENFISVAQAVLNPMIKKTKPSSTRQEIGDMGSENLKQEVQSESIKIEEVSTPNYSDLQKTIEKKFKKDINGQFVDVAGVLAMLNDFAERYSDDHIRELYVFNEKTGMFEWNTESVTS